MDRARPHTLLTDLKASVIYTICSPFGFLNEINPYGDINMCFQCSESGFYKIRSCRACPKWAIPVGTVCRDRSTNLHHVDLPWQCSRRLFSALSRYRNKDILRAIERSPTDLLLGIWTRLMMNIDQYSVSMYTYVHFSILSLSFCKYRTTYAGPL